MAPQVDHLFYFYLVAVGSFAVLIFILLPWFAIHYRRRKVGEVPKQIHGNTKLEITWTVIPLIIVMFLFAWGAKIYVEEYSSPKNAMEIFVTGKQWMWKIQHPEGRREINALHVPINRAVKLTMTSEDVIHSFYIPAFRIKRDVVPGRYSSYTFTADKVGRYHLFCAEYCGSDHSKMVGWVYVMKQGDYDKWLKAGGTTTVSMDSAGKTLFEKYACDSCHNKNSGARGPDLHGLYGSTVNLQGGGQVVANDTYIRESILTPKRKIVAGFNPIMPTFKGQIDEEGISKITAYLKTLKNPIELSKSTTP